MLFNSLDFAIFLPIVFLLYWFVFKRNRGAQNVLLLIASYVFYGWWDWRFLILIVISSITDYTIGILLAKEKQQLRRSLLLFSSVIVNLGILGFFKYFNFFIESFIDFFGLFNVSLSYNTLRIILPVGISFYTFQTLSYTIDIYRREFEPTKNIISFFAYVSFFPQLVAGPIERARNLLPQFEKERTFDLAKASDGMRQILWGLFKKIVIADNLSSFVDQVFSNSGEMPGSMLFLGVVLFSIQIYCDFSGYSDIAIGTARLFGFDLMQNFRFPYFSKNITEMWRRWHISLSTWLRDYLFIPLSIKFRNSGSIGIAAAIMITFILCGLWHGARWTYIVFGFWQGLIMVYEFYSTKRRKKIRKKMNPLVYNGISLFLTFIFWQFSMIFFRATSLEHAFSFIGGMFDRSIFDFSMGTLNSLVDNMALLKYLLFIPFLLIMEIVFRNRQHALEIQHLNVFLRYSLYAVIAISILMLAPLESSQFIYFQF